MSMDMEFEGHVAGWDEALASVRRVADVRARQNILRGGIRVAGKVIAEQARVNLRAGGHVRTGALLETVRVSTRIVRGAGNLAIGVGVDGVSGKVKAGKRSKGVFWARLVEGGTRPHRIAPKGFGNRKPGLYLGGRWVARVQHPGSKPAQFMERAGQQAATAAGAAFSQYVERRLARLAASASQGGA